MYFYKVNRVNSIFKKFIVSIAKIHDQCLILQKLNYITNWNNIYIYILY